jgi:hypothetical protein
VSFCPKLKGLAGSVRHIERSVGGTGLSERSDRAPDILVSNTLAKHIHTVFFIAAFDTERARYHAAIEHPAQFLLADIGADIGKKRETERSPGLSPTIMPIGSKLIAEHDPVRAVLLHDPA